MLEGNGAGPALRLTSAAATRTVGTAMAVIPVMWVVSSALVRALAITWADAWTTDGRIFLAPQFYSDIFVACGPWMLAGVVLVTASGHLHQGRP
jgi:hypothetical protein